MKKLIITMMCAAMTAGAAAQVKNANNAGAQAKLQKAATAPAPTVKADTIKEELKLLDIPMNTNIEEMGKKLEEKGFKIYHSNENKDIAATGDYEGHENSVINIRASRSTVTAQKADILLTPVANWSELHAMYTDYKTNLTKKYGEPKTTETFEGTQPKNDEEKMQKLANNECNYSCVFTPDGNKVTLSLIGDDTGLGNVNICIEDIQTTKKAFEAARKNRKGKK